MIDQSPLTDFRGWLKERGIVGGVRRIDERFHVFLVLARDLKRLPKRYLQWDVGAESGEPMTEADHK